MAYEGVGKTLNESILSLQNLASTRNGKLIPYLIDRDLIQKLVYHLSGPNYQTIKDSIKLIGTFTYEDACTPLLLQANLFDRMYQLLVSECPDFLKQEVCWILSNFAADSQDTIDQLV